MRKIILLLISVVFLFSLTYCATTPPEEEKPEEKPVEEQEPVSDAKVQEAEEALAKAKQVGAETYAQDLYQAAADDLQSAKDIKESNPDKARSLLDSSIEKANNAYDASLKAALQEFQDQFQKKKEKLLTLQADKFRPDTTQDLFDRAPSVEQLYDQGKFQEAQEKGNKLLEEMDTLYSNLEEDIEIAYNEYQALLAEKAKKLLDIEADQFRPQRSENLYGSYQNIEDLYENNNYVEAKQQAEQLLDSLDTFYDQLMDDIHTAQSLKQDTHKNLSQARSYNAGRWTPDTYKEAENLYENGTEAYDSYNIDRSIELLQKAKLKSSNAASLAEYRQSRYDYYMTRLTSYQERLQELDADKFRPEKTNELIEQYNTTREALEDEQYAQAEKQAGALLEDVRSFYEELNGRIRYAEVLKRDAANNRELAEKENAPKWSPAEFRKGEENFEDGEQAYANYDLEKSIDNYQEAKYYFQQASRLAPQRRDQYTNYVRQIENYRKKLAEIDADEFRPKKSQNLDNRVQEARSTYDQGDYLEARELASSLVEDYKAFYRDLYEEVQYARNLKQSIVNGLDKAEEAEAHIWSPEELQQASIMYSRGVSAYRNFELEQSINLFEKAQTLAQKAIQLAPRRKAKYESGSLMEEVRKEIEEASELTIMTEEGEIIAPEDREEEEESGENQEGEQHSFLLDDGSIIVILGDESESDLLTQAKELYRKGVQAREQGDYEEAKEYFSKAGQLVHRYKALAIGDIETVQVRKSNSLWYLAGQQYKSPLYWPFIWVLNMDKVNDPDLIYPGWKLMVPVR